MVVALAVDLLGLRQQRLDALAQLHERVAGVRLLDDAGDQLADAVAVLLEHHVALGLADPLQDHLLGGLRGDPAEVVRRDVADLDLVLELGQARRDDLRRLGDDHLARLRVDAALELARGLLLGLVEQLVLEVLGQQELLDAEVAEVAVHAHARVARGAGLLLVGGQQRVLERVHELLLGDALLAPESPDGFDDLCDMCSVSHEVRTVDVGVGDRHHAGVGGDGDRVVGGVEQLAGEGRRPSCSPRVRTRARRPT